MDIIAVVITGMIFSLGLIINYQPKVRKFKKAQEKMQSKFREHFNNLSGEEKESFFSSLNNSQKASLQDFMDNPVNDNFEQQIFMDQMSHFNEWAMSEGLKSVTPFDHGGYVMGPGFNPSDTMAFDFQQMDMNNSMNDSMNNFNDNSFNDFNSMNNF